MKEQLIVRIDEDLKKRFKRTSMREGKSMSDKVISLINDYVSQNDFYLLVDRVWEKIGKDLREKGYSQNSMEEVIKEVRESKSE